MRLSSSSPPGNARGEMLTSCCSPTPGLLAATAAATEEAEVPAGEAPLCMLVLLLSPAPPGPLLLLLLLLLLFLCSVLGTMPRVTPAVGLGWAMLLVLLLPA